MNEKRRPPLTTLATRLISTTRSLSSRVSAKVDSTSELQSSLARAVGERLDASVVQVAAAVEDDASMPAFFAAAASCLPTSAACSVLLPLNDFFSASQRAAASVLPRQVVDELGLDALVRAEHDEARPLGGAGDLAAHAPVAAQACLRVTVRGYARFPTFRRTYSPS